MMRNNAVLLLALTLLTNSCGVVRFRSSPDYHSGAPVSGSYIPEGIVEERSYPCSSDGPSSRRMIVYLPGDYYENDHSYPVFYLLHGARGYETSWIRRGRVLQITDSLWRNDAARKCIIVMPNVNQYDDDMDFDDSRYKDCLESLFEVNGTVERGFIDDVVNYVDGHFRSIPSKEHRAIAGLSIGGLQSLFISANYPETFGYIGLFSPLCRIIRKPGPDSGFYRRRNRKVSQQFAEGNGPEGYQIYIGRSDFLRPHVMLFTKMLSRRGLEHTVTISGGGHQWFNWNAYYADMLCSVFRLDEEPERQPTAPCQ